MCNVTIPKYPRPYGPVRLSPASGSALAYASLCMVWGTTNFAYPDPPSPTAALYGHYRASCTLIMNDNTFSHRHSPQTFVAA